MDFKAYTSEEMIAAVAARIREGRDFVQGATPSISIPRPGSQTLASFDVLFGSVVRTVTVIDSGKRPPEPDGVWIDDLLSAACRNIAGATRGSCRKLQGTDQFEFREYWTDPTRYKVVENVTVEYAPEMKRASDVVNVETTAYPGADVASVVFASAYLLLERKFGGGKLEWVKNRDCLLRFEANPGNAVNHLVQCRYTIVMNGGVSKEIVINIPAAESRNWGSIRNAVQNLCRPTLGPGVLQYAPELGETNFYWK